MNSQEMTHTLPAGYVLNNRYIIDYVRGEGGFGITYAGHIKDSDDTIPVAIKEYFPSGVAGRDHNDTPYKVTHFGGDYSVSFRKGLQRFLNEAVLLKEFSKLDSIVTIIDVFEANSTAYLVMDFIEGISMKQLIQTEGILPFSDMYKLMLPVMKDLCIIHEKGLIHRDISPDNLLVGLDNRLHLIDFGSVSVVNPNETKTMTVILKAGYAPPEQYLANGRIGPWTDVYGLAATMHYILTGKAPVDALIRMQQDNPDLFPFPTDSDIKPYQWNAIVKALSLSYSERYSSVKAFYHALSIPAMNDEPKTIMMKPGSTVTQGIDTDNNKHSSKQEKISNIIYQNLPAKKFSLIQKATLSIAFLCILVIIIIAIQKNHDDNNKSITSDIKTESSQSTTDDMYSNTDNNKADDITETTTEADEMLTMINLTGMTIENAATTISELDPDIKLKTIYQYNENYPIGIVTFQSITTDSSFAKGSVKELTLTVSKGASPTTESVTSSDSETTTEASANSHTESTTQSQTTKNSEKKGTKENTTESKYTTIHLD